MKTVNQKRIFYYQIPQCRHHISQKVIAVVTDNAANVINAVRDIDEVQEQDGLTCAAHTLQLVVNDVLAFDDIQEICQKAGKLVGHFRHSSTATTALQSK